MIINKRPSTTVDGHKDSMLLTDIDKAEQYQVAEWIRKNIFPTDGILEDRTSYGLKHVLQEDTGIYLSNNAFKDAMLLAGHSPVNPDELNWHFRIKLAWEVTNNSNPFMKWCASNQEMMNGPERDFVKDMLEDKEFPVLGEKEMIETHLLNAGACLEAQEAFQSLWKAYMDD